MNLGKYQKALAALVTGIIGWAGVVIAANEGHFGHISDAQWLALAVVVATTLGVYAVPNQD